MLIGENLTLREAIVRWSGRKRRVAATTER
jgi:hypothetical protein